MLFLKLYDIRCGNWVTKEQLLYSHKQHRRWNSGHNQTHERASSCATYRQHGVWNTTAQIQIWIPLLRSGVINSYSYHCLSLTVSRMQSGFSNCFSIPFLKIHPTHSILAQISLLSLNFHSQKFETLNFSLHTQNPSAVLCKWSFDHPLAATRCISFQYLTANQAL